MTSSIRGGASLRFRVIGDADSAIKAIRKTQTEAEHATGKIKGSFKKLVGLGAGMLAVGSVAGFFKDSIAEASAYGKITRQTAAAIKSTGSAAGVTAGQVGELAKSIAEKTGIDKASIQTGENLLLTFTHVRNEVGKGNDIFNQATKTAVDMSVALGEDSKSAALQLGKALNDPIRGVSQLRRVGVSFTKDQQTQIKTLASTGHAMEAQKLVLAELNREFGGSAAAQATSGAKLKVAMSELREEVGNALLPVMKQLNLILMHYVVPALSATFHWVKDNQAWLKPLAASVLGVWVAFKGYAILRGVAQAFQLAGLRYKQMIAQMSYGNVVQRGASTGLQTVGGTLGGLSGKLIRGGVVVGAAVKIWSDYQSAANRTKAEIEGLTAAIQADNGALAENTRQALVNKIQHDKPMGGGHGSDSEKSTYDLLHGAKVSVTEYVDALTKGPAAMQTFRLHLIAMGKAYDKKGDDARRDEIVELLTYLPRQSSEMGKAAAKARELGSATKGAVAPTKTLTAAQQAAADTAKQQAATLKAIATEGLKTSDAIDALTASFDQLNARTIDAAQAEIGFKNGIADLDKALKGSNHSLSINTAKGREHLSTIFDSIHAAQADSEATEKRTNSAVKAQSAYRADIRTLREHLTQLGYQPAAVQRIIDKYARMPRYKATKVDVLDYATDNLKAIQRYLDLLAKGVTVPVISKGGFSYLPGASTGGVGHAAGTSAAPAGWAWVGERGPELMRFRGGERVLSHPNSVKAARGFAAGTTGLGGNGGGGRIVGGTLSIDSDSQGRLFARVRDVVLDEMSFTDAIGRMNRR